MNRAGFTMWVCLGLALAALGAPGNAAQQKKKGASTANPAATSTADRGQRVFEQNCSRCHTAPEGFSPRISGTVVRHMRERANLSGADMKALLEFLHPQSASNH